MPGLKNATDYPKMKNAYESLVWGFYLIILKNKKIIISFFHHYSDRTHISLENSTLLQSIIQWKKLWTTFIMTSHKHSLKEHIG